MKIGLGLSLTGQSRRADQIITAVIRPALGVLVDGDAIEDALSADIGETSNYASTAGSITSVTVTATVNGDPADLTDTVSFQDAVVVTVTVQDDASNERVFALSRVVTALVPEAFTAPDWDVVNDDGTISVNILTLPSDGGAPITDIEYRVNEGAAISLGETTTGSYEITADVDDDVQIRAVNAIGPGDWSDTKVVPEASDLDPDAAAYIGAVEAEDEDVLEPAIVEAINDFVVGCKDDEIWDAIKASCIMAGARTLSGALVPLAGPAPTNNNFVSVDYDRVSGLKGDGIAKFINSERADSDDPQNNHHLAVFVQEFDTTGVNAFIAGHGENPRTHILVQNIGESDQRLRSRHRNESASGIGGAPGRGIPGPYLCGISRNNAANYLEYLGGDTRTVPISSNAPSSTKIDVFKGGDTFSSLFDGRLTFYSIGESIDFSALDARVTALMTAIEDALT